MKKLFRKKKVKKPPRENSSLPEEKSSFLKDTFFSLWALGALGVAARDQGHAATPRAPRAQREKKVSFKNEDFSSGREEFSLGSSSSFFFSLFFFSLLPSLLLSLPFPFHLPWLGFRLEALIILGARVCESVF